MSGILYLLLKAKVYLDDKIIQGHVKQTLDYLMTLQFKSGNFPSSLKPHMDDKLVHWCHGAPGVIYVLVEAFKVYGDEKFLMKAHECGEVIWKRGLLKKGCGMCHGVSGNAYAFLSLWRATKDPKYLHRTGVFISWCFKTGQRGEPDPDRPFSLFEGLGGVVYLLTDVLQGLDQARFPAFEL